MYIKNEKPPIWEEANAMFEIDHSRAIYTYGDTIYNPAAIAIDELLLVHESVHSGQQEQCGGPQNWWRKYLADKNFRLDEEVEAYHAQYRAMCKRYKDGNTQTRYLHEIASHLASPLYKIGISQPEAMRRIRTGV